MKELKGENLKVVLYIWDITFSKLSLIIEGTTERYEQSPKVKQPFTSNQFITMIPPHQISRVFMLIYNS
jgi:hypothetical protein